MLASTINGALTVRCRHVNCTLLVFYSRMSICSIVLLALLLLTVQVVAQEDTLPAKAGTEALRQDSLSEKTSVETALKDTLPEKDDIEAVQEDSISEKVGMKAIQLDSLPEKDDTEATREDSPSKETDIEPAQKEPVQEKASTKKSELVNVVLGNRRVRPYGWGEYRVPGTCLCCDNKNDGDCIVVHSIERTNRMRISQIIDGKIEGDTSNIRTYFGDLRKRDKPEHVSLLMVDMPLGKMYEIKKVIVYTMMDKEKRINFLSNCEFGYYDQFSRLQWTGRVKSKKYDEPITFEMENPVLTKKIMLRVKGGKNIITEVAIFCDTKTDDKP